MNVDLRHNDHRGDPDFRATLVSPLPAMGPVPSFFGNYAADRGEEAEDAD
jgi:hypothetical protein